MKDDIYAFIVDPKSRLEVLNEAPAGNVDVGEVHFGGDPPGNEPLLLDPEIQGLHLDVQARQKILPVHGAISSRGFHTLPASQFATNCSSWGSGGFGRTTFNLTNWAPAPPLRRGAPLPLRRRSCRCSIPSARSSS